MKAANESMMTMTDAGKKMAVMKEMDIAKDMMAKKDEKGCSAQLHKAMGMMTNMDMKRMDMKGMEMKSGMDMKMGSSGNRVGKSNGECGLKAHRD